jgi:tRNA(fMet)-specific endonuclease VapC
MIVLDTDHMSVLERSDHHASATLRERLSTLSPVEVATTIISYEEQMQGWMAYIARTRSVAQQVEAYSRLLRHLDNYRRIPVLAFDAQAAVEFQRLRRARIRIGTVSTPPPEGGGFVRNACVDDHYVSPNRLSPSPKIS